LLSGGEQRMLALGRALAGEPRLLLADEMSLGLAPAVVKDLMIKLREAAAASGTAVLLVEQQARHALRVADRGYVLRRGRIALAGSSTKLAENDFAELESLYLSDRRPSGEPSS
jgi:branched-chain amino acid transport system ATP-binding protein